MVFGWFGDTAMNPFILFGVFFFISWVHTKLQPSALLPSLTLK